MSTSLSDLSDRFEEGGFLAALEALCKSREAMEDLPDGVVQCLLTAGVKAYAAKVQAGQGLFPFTSREVISQTEAGLAASSIIRAADVELFELAIWHRLSNTDQTP